MIRKYIAALAIASALALTACSTVSSDGFSRMGWSKSALSGQEIVISSHSDVKIDCKPAGIPELRIVQQPKNGHVSFRRERVYPSLPVGSPARKCNSVPVSGISAFYRSNRGFVGTDEIVLRAGFSGGQVDEVRVKVNVR